MDKKHLIVEQVRGCEGDCLVMDENRVAGPKPWGGGRVVKKWLLDRRQVQEIVKICKRFLGEEPDDRWIPVSERMPTFEDFEGCDKDNCYITVKRWDYENSCYKSSVSYAHWTGDYFTYGGGIAGGEIVGVTHWMLPPAPPKEVQT